MARLAVLTALGVLFLLLARVIPAGRLGLMVLTSFPVCMTLMMYGPGWAFGVFAATAALGLLLFPGGPAALYILFFGYYPIAKSFFERTRAKGLGWALKYALYAAVFAAAYCLGGKLGLVIESALPWFALLLAGAAAFAVYDICYSIVIRFYLDKIARYLS